MNKDIVGVGDSDIVTDLVKRDYRTADIFQRFGIDFCCGGKLPLNIVCRNKAVDLEELKKALNEVSLTHFLSSTNAYNEWSIDFMLDFIVNVHHDYLRKTLPVIEKYITVFASGHSRKFPFLAELESEFYKLGAVMLPKLQEEEDIIFPYIRQIAHAYQNMEPYARLLVKTLRKPLDTLMFHNQEFTSHTFSEVRRLTNNYSITTDSCTTQQVLYKKIEELEMDLFQHIFLENNILYPKTIAMEKELLMQSGL
ncbi:MAG: DUF542 domain-containing protein [Chitinophagaceae bacterium]|jgi:regulator of cell morphogenesis and NO signaling|nr:DUF542 domain-containing protein [Chitinophagaceae bacterium]